MRGTPNEPSESRPVQLACGNCNGDGCEQCNHTGYMAITQCPMTLLPEGTFEVLDSIEDVQHGRWPIDGGTLDQADAFYQAVKLVESENEAWKARLTHG